MGVYEPREDSFLLQKFVKKFAKGYVLDMGTGSGILAEEAAQSKKVVKVFGVDINEEAIVHCIRNQKSKKIIFAKSNLFSLFRDYKPYRDIKFDLVIFNPPYLPSDDKAPDTALDGGNEGYELICRFLHESERWLRPNGKILLLFSSFTGKEKLDSFLGRNFWEFKELAREHIWFEDLTVYAVSRIPKENRVIQRKEEK
ncbi:methyltransferase [Candidatus Woesearchaeota archaeon]|nr:methyltransferase [Candidatus Woesearchaeota archaeon]